MKYLNFLFIIILTITFISSTIAKDSPKDWEKFSENLVMTLKSQNDGLKQSAMQRIIQYSNNLHVKDAAFDLYNVYRFNDNESFRRLALIALYNTNSDWAMNQIVNDSKTEQSLTLKKQMNFMINEYYKGDQTDSVQLATN